MSASSLAAGEITWLGQRRSLGDDDAVDRAHHLIKRGRTMASLVVAPPREWIGRSLSMSCCVPAETGVEVSMVVISKANGDI